MFVLNTHRLLLRPFTMDDLEDAHRILDEDIEWSGLGVTLERRRELLQLQVALGAWKLTKGIYGDRAMVLREDNRLIGLCGFRPWILKPEERALFDPDALVADHPFNAPELGIGYAVATPYQRKGYATEAISALIQYAFETLKIRRIVAHTGRGNDGSVAVMRKVGMRVGINSNADYPWGVGLIENSAEGCWGET